MSLYERFRNLRDAFRACFEHDQWRTEDGDLTLHARRVLTELRLFCRANETTVVVAKDGHIDTHATLLAEGRRETLLRIQHYIELTDTDLLKLVDPDEQNHPKTKDAQQ